jgi:hypothetical protein
MRRLKLTGVMGACLAAGWMWFWKPPVFAQVAERPAGAAADSRLGPVAQAQDPRDGAPAEPRRGGGRGGNTGDNPARGGGPGGGPGGGMGGFNPGGPGGFGPGGFGPGGAMQRGRDSFTETVALLGELNLSPEFELAKEQRQRIQALRTEFQAAREKWQQDFAEQSRALDEQMRAARDSGKLEEIEALTQKRQDLMSAAPKAYEATTKLKAILTPDQLKALETFVADKRKTDDAARRPAGGGPGGPGGRGDVPQ